jgi:hypothetical protein
MTVRINKTHPALKHAGYSTTTILPGEDAAEFAKLHRQLIAEFVPHGALEEDVVTTIAHLVWRRRNLATFRIAERAQKLVKQMRIVTLPAGDGDLRSSDSTEFDKNFMDKWQAAKSRAREELGEYYGLIEMGEGATLTRLGDELEVQSRLDAMIDRCIKRLLLVRGVKSMSIGSDSRAQLPGPSKVA